MNICRIYSVLAKDFQNIKNLPIKFGIKMLYHALDKEIESKAWGMWLTKYPDMDKNTFVPFSKFYDDMKPKQISKKDTKTMIEEAKQIRKSLGK